MEEVVKEKKVRKRKPKLIITLGKRKKAVARAIAKPGKGVILINKKPIDFQPEIARLLIQEPLILADDTAKQLDINVNVSGGGTMGQAEASRQAIALALVEMNKDLKQKFLDYDKSLLVADPRRTEPHKPGPSEPRTHKQRSKR